ncbi:MAG: thermopsin family protease, partial [Patescibacteria group bacterium]|nr:thermopsin family protease [Patescibacteria group bacterium]
MNGLVVWVGICGIIVTFFVGFLLPAYADSATYPIGIVADGYGTENETGSPYKIDVPYEINTNSIMGIARINSVQVDPPNSGASLQLNIVLHTITTTGKTDYWLQNVLRFPNTNYQTANFETNVWNMTDIKNNSKICPNLNPFEYILCKIGGPYIKFSNSFTYQLPFTESIFIYEQVIPQKGVKILLGYDGGGKGKIYASKTIPIPNIISASLLVTPNTKIQNYLSYDSELVWGGIGGGKMGDFSSMDSTLYLFYNDTSIQVIHDPSQPYVVNTWKPFPGYNTEGHDTEETAYNIYSTLSSNNNGTAFIKL